MTRYAVAAILLATAVVSCDSAPRELDVGGSWDLVRADTPLGHMVFQDGVGPSINLDVGQATSGCTLYSISATTTGGDDVELTVSDGGEMRCGFEIEDPFRGRFGGVLRSVDSLTQRQGRLVLTGDGIHLVFETTNRLY